MEVSNSKKKPIHYTRDSMWDFIS